MEKGFERRKNKGEYSSGEKKEGLGEMYQKYDDGSTRLTLEGFLNVLEGWEEQKTKGADRFDDWTENVDGLPETIKSLIGEGYMGDEDFNSESLIEKLYNENLVLERLYYDFQNHETPGAYTEQEIENLCKDDPAEAGSRTEEPKQRRSPQEPESYPDTMAA